MKFGIRILFNSSAGQERYRSLAPLYYRNAQAAVVVYDITTKVNYCLIKEYI